jgi:hypothetical protein
MMPWYEVIAVAIFLVAVLELACGYILYPLRYGYSYYLPVYALHIFAYDPRNGYRLRPNLSYSNPTAPHPKAPRRVMMVDIRTDRNGFFSAADVATIGGRKIFCIGGSTTAGIESRHDRHYPAALDRLVAPLGYRCINAGVGGYRSIHELAHFRSRVAPFKPWGVIIFSGYNDFEDYAHGIWRPHDPFSHCLSGGLPTGNVEYLIRYSALWAVMKRLWYKYTGRVRTESAPTRTAIGLKASLDDPRWLDEWRQNIGKIMSICRRRDIKCFMISHPTPVYAGAPDAAKSFADADINMDGRFDAFVRYVALIDREAQALCRKWDATYLDISECFAAPFVKPDGEVDYKARFGAFVDRCHLTEEGNERLAHCIASALRGYL